MLPGGPLAKKQMTKLKIYKGEAIHIKIKILKLIDFKNLNKKNIIKKLMEQTEIKKEKTKKLNLTLKIANIQQVEEKNLLQKYG